MVPCQPAAYLDLEYGATKWQIPDRNSKWKNLFGNRRWLDNEWPYVMRVFDAKGHVKYNYTLKKLNEHISPKLSRIPLEEILQFRN